MPISKREVFGRYLKEALIILKEKGGEYPSADLIEELEKRLVLSQEEQGINNSGQPCWVTDFRFSSIGLVKAGWIVKNRRIWKLTADAKDFEHMSPEDVYNFSSESYNNWNNNRLRQWREEEAEVVEEAEEPEVFMKVKPDDITFRDLISGIASCRIQIPPFQRSFVWSANDIRYLLDSIYRGFPIGSFIFWKTSRKLPHTRNIGDIILNDKDISSGTEIAYVLDGQQRITSLYAAVEGSRIEDEHFRFLFDLAGKKFIVSKTEDENDGDWQERDVEKLQIPIGTIFTESRASYSQIIRKYPEEYAEVLDNLYDRFVSYRFSAINVIDQESADSETQKKSVKQVVDMFSRINETGKKLTVVAKMVARCWGEGFDLRESLDNFFEQNEELEAIREETYLQATSVILNYRKCQSKVIWEKTDIPKLKKEWDNINQAFLLAIDFLKTKLHIRKLDYVPFDAVLVPLTYLFYKKHELNHEQTVIVEQWFWLACLSNRYSATVESKIEKDCESFDELLEGKVPEFKYYIDWETLKARLIEQDYYLRNAFVKTVLSLYSYACPKNLVDGRDVSLEGVFSGYSKHNLHHIFPQAYLRNNKPEDKNFFDSIVNIMFIPAITNQGIKDKAPSAYLPDLRGTNAEFKDILDHHYIPSLEKSRLLEDDFTGFLDYRADQIFRAFRVCTGIGSASEELFETNPTKPVDRAEESIRHFIHENLKREDGKSYWRQCIVSDIQEAVEKKVQEAIKRQPYKAEELRQDEARIGFLDIMDYCKIITTNWQVFEKCFVSKSETEKHFIALKNYRNAIKHGRDLDEVEKRNGEAAVLWLENILKQGEIHNNA